MPVSGTAKAILARMLGRSKTVTAVTKSTSTAESPPAVTATGQPVIVERATMRPRGRREYQYELRNEKSNRVRVERLWIAGHEHPLYRYTRIRGRRSSKKPRYKTEHARRRI